MISNIFIVKLDRWARENGLSYTTSYSDSDGSYEVKIISTAPSEEYYSKRNYNFNTFLEGYNTSCRLQKQS